MMFWQKAMHSLKMQTRGPTISFPYVGPRLPQKEHGSEPSTH